MKDEHIQREIPAAENPISSEDDVDVALEDWKRTVRADKEEGPSMLRFLWPITTVVALAAAGVMGYFTFLHKPQTIDPNQTVKMKVRVLVPHEKGQVTIDKKEYAGTGMLRNLEVVVPAATEAVAVSVLWEPNNYTKITRKKALLVREDADLEVDLREKDPQHPDAIVVRFVPTPDDIVEEMCKMAKVGPDDVVYDLGCGDGRMVITAVKNHQAKRGVGVELDPKLVEECKLKAKQAGVADKVEFREGNVLKVQDLSDATVVLLYMGEDINLRLRPILQKTLKPGARIVSHRFTMGDWEPQVKKTIRGADKDDYDLLMWEIEAPPKKAEKNKDAKEYQVKVKLLRQSDSKGAEAVV
jgi:precorrin-6B methylase 2